jgi:type I restriction enzyme, S subunit
MKNPTLANPAMTDNLLYEQFATLTTAPEGIARLRELILQLAVQGKLGTQDAGDEPARVAVDAFFRKNKHIKKKHFVNIEEKSLLPNGWIPITLGNIGQWALGTGFPISIQGHTDKPILFCKVSDMNLPGNEKWIKTTNHTIDEEIKNQYNIKIHSEGTVIFPKIGGAIATNKRRIISRLTAIDNNCLGITPNDFCSTDWLFLILTSIDFTQYQSGTSMPALNQGTLAEIVTSLPPLAEQQRIIVKVDRLMALCDELEARQLQERAGCLKLGTASLARLQNAESPKEFLRQWAQVCDAFDLILDCPENVTVLRQTILQLAVQGRLVRQEPGDEPVKKLVDRIRKERERLVKEGKIKRLKILKPINGVEVPYSLPNGWTWIRFPEIGELSRGKSKNRPRNDPILYINGKYPLIQTGDVSRANGIVKTYSALYNETGLKQSRLWPKGTMCITIAANIAETALLGFDACFPDSVVGFIPHNEIENTKYFEFFMRTAKQHLEKFAPQTAQKNINIEILENLLIPLPPLAEQHRIVAKVDALMALCDALESRLKGWASIQARLAGAVVKQVAG